MLTKDETQHIANLARIGLTEEELEKYALDLSGILDWMKQLEEVNTENVEPTSHIIGLKDISRQDKVEKFEASEKIVKLFPEEKNGYDKVKAVL